jgi:hypothetical protein
LMSGWRRLRAIRQIGAGQFARCVARAARRAGGDLPSWHQPRST